MSNENRPCKDFGKRLEDTIIHRATTKAFLSRECGVSQPSMTKYCQGWHKPTVRILQKMCETLNCTAEWLVNGAGSIGDRYDYDSFSASNKSSQRIYLERNGKDFSLIVKLNEREVAGMFKTCLA